MNARLIFGLLAFLVATEGRAQSVLQSSWGSATWVWDEPEANTQAQNDAPRYFRKRFTLSAEPVKAELWVTADNEHATFVNGQKVGDGKEWSKVDRLDVSKQLHSGGNVLAIRAQNHGGVACMIARLWVKTIDNNETLIVSNAEMRVSQTASDGWNSVGFTDKDWANAVVLGDASIGPWNVVSSATAQVKA